MRTEVPEKILQIIDNIDAQKNVPLTRLTVLKKWFEHPHRLPAFGLWVARRASGRKGKTKGDAGALLDETRTLLGTASTAESLFQQIDRASAKSLHDRARDFQNEFREEEQESVRIIQCRPLLLVEEGLSLHLGITDSPESGYKFAADWAQHYDSKYGAGLNGPSRGKLQELVRIMYCIEALEDRR